jgi:hypothetical protein
VSVSFTITASTGEVTEGLRALLDGVSDLTPFFDGLRPVWYDSRRTLYATQGDSAETPWPKYSDTPERLRYVYAKASILDYPGGRMPDSDVLLWGGDGRLRRAVVGESTETTWVSTATSATMTVDVEYASNHDEGRGVAPMWAWPQGEPYQIPTRRLTSVAGDFERGFSAELANYMAASGDRLGLRTEDVLSDLRRTYAAGVS